MLSNELEPLGFDTWEKETWDSYCIRLALPKSEGVRQFFRQVPYDHFHHFNERYPAFEVEDYEFSIVRLTAAEAAAKIRFFGNNEMRMWCWQYDEFERKNQDYPVFRFMAENRTTPFPPVVIDPKNLRHDYYIYGEPMHLIEGTHRVSYLVRMLERGLITPESVHEFVLVSPL